jgi:hypothetical protein
LGFVLELLLFILTVITVLNARFTGLLARDIFVAGMPHLDRLLKVIVAAIHTVIVFVWP